MGTLQCTPECSCCPGLGCHTGSQQAGAVWLGLRVGVPAPSRGTEEEQTVTRECWETGLPSVPALPHPQAQGWLSMTFWDQGPSSKSEGGATAPSFSPSWLPSNANSPWLGEKSGSQVLGYEHSSCSPGSGWSLPREGVWPWARFLQVFSSNRFRCWAGLDQQEHRLHPQGWRTLGGFTEAAGAQ